MGSQDHRGHHKQRSYAGRDTRRQTEREGWRMVVAGYGDGWMDGMGWVVVMVTVAVAVAVVVLMTIKSNSIGGHVGGVT